jgi:hypothetical protein
MPHLPAAALSGLGKASSPGMYSRRTPPTQIPVKTNSYLTVF